jgi:hypothetical protein
MGVEWLDRLHLRRKAKIFWGGGGAREIWQEGIISYSYEYQQIKIKINFFFLL